MKDKETIGVVLLNLGGPDSLQAIKPFLYNLFSDREIIRLGPSFLQKPLAWFISNIRSKKTEEMYRFIGGKSSILDITTAQAQAIEKTLNKLSIGFRVYIGMRYWHPFIKDTVNKILGDGIKHLIVLSLYPHYSKATTGSAITEFKKAIEWVRGQGSGVRIKYIEQWYDFPPYIDALAELIAKGIAEFNENPPISPFSKGGDKEGNLFSKKGLNSPLLRGVRGVSPPLTKGGFNVDILYSAHSLPQYLIDAGDPYLDHIKTTIREVNKKLSIPPHHPLGKGGQGGGNHSSLITHHSSLLRWHLSFQSKSGPVKWLKPATEETIIKLAKTGVKNLFVVPISFVSDNIETLYEIDILYKKLAEKHGINFKRCEALNTSEKFIEALKELVLTKL